MNLRRYRLLYGEALLYLLRLEVAGVRRPSGAIEAFREAQRWQRIADLCDRFERLQATLAGPPLVWDGDYA